MTTRFTRGPVHVAYDVLGDGPLPLLVIPGWVSHLAYDWETPEIRAWYERLAAGRRLIRYDKRGTGLSDRPAGPETYSPAVQMADALAVLDAAGVQRAAVLGWSEGGPIAISLAAAHPERVSHLVLYGTYAKLHAAPDYPYGTDGARGRALLDLVRAEWGLGSRAFADLFVPDADLQRQAWLTAYQRVTTSPRAAADFLTATLQIDLRHLLPQVHQPALVLHRREDRVIPFALGAYLAQHLPNARLQALSGEHHLPYFGDSTAVEGAIDAFLPEADAGAPAAALSSREVEVLRLLAEGHQNREIALRLQISQATVARHLANIYAKLGVSTRAAAAAWAFRRGLV